VTGLVKRIAGRLYPSEIDTQNVSETARIKLDGS